MRRQASLLFLCVFAASVAGQIAACSSDDSSTQPGGDAGPGADANQPGDDGGLGFGCFGALPVMTVRGDGGGQIAPDWSCYADGAVGSYVHVFRPFDTDDGGDAGDDAGDASDASDSGPVTGQDAGSDAGTDASAPVDAGPADYKLHITDFSSAAPPVGASVDLFWGKSTEGTPVFNGTVDENGILSFPTPPAGTAFLSYHLIKSTDQEPVYWHGQPIVPPGVDIEYFGDGQTEANSVSTSTQQTLLTSVFGSETPRLDLAVLVSAAVDCSGNDLQGAQFTLIDDATGTPISIGTTAGSPRSFYFINDIPDQKCTYTNNVAKGVWTLANAPVNEPGATHSYSLRMSGRMTSDDPAEGRPIHEEPAELYTGGITLMLPRLLSGPPPNVPDGG